jgi:hypothetical protein
MLESEEPDAGTRKNSRRRPTVRLSGVVLAAVPRFGESHIVPRMQFNPPAVVFCFRRGNQTKRRTEPLNRKRLHHYAAVIDRPYSDIRCSRSLRACSRSKAERVARSSIFASKPSF